VYPLATLSLNNQLQNEYLHGERQASDRFLVSLALAISLALHFSIMQALPWLEAVKTKLPVTIVAELQTLPPPPPPQAEPKPIETPTQTEVAKPQQPILDKPAPKPQPVLATKNAEQEPTDYKVPDIPQAVSAPSEPAAPATPVVEESRATPAASSNNAPSASSSTSTWDDSDVWDEYGRNLQKMCERNKQYPEIARRRGWQGAGKVIVRFSAEGKTISVAIEQSTGQQSLDNQALEMVRKSLADLPLPLKFKGKEFKLTIPVDFKLE
jgi:protein TonB